MVTTLTRKRVRRFYPGVPRIRHSMDGPEFASPRIYMKSHTHNESVIGQIHALPVDHAALPTCCRSPQCETIAPEGSRSHQADCLASESRWILNGNAVTHLFCPSRVLEKKKLALEMTRRLRCVYRCSATRHGSECVQVWLVWMLAHRPATRDPLAGGRRLERDLSRERRIGVRAYRAASNIEAAAVCGFSSLNTLHALTAKPSSAASSLASPCSIALRAPRWLGPR
jgi:hypothetical protein